MYHIMAKNTKAGRSQSLYEAILHLENVEECIRFFDDLCTPTELKSMEQRFEVAVYLLQNRVYTDILQKTGTSSATVSRVRRTIIDNDSGGAMKEVIVRCGLDKEERHQGEKDD